MIKYWVILSKRISRQEARQFRQRCLNDPLLKKLDTEFKIIPSGYDNKFHVIRSVSEDEYDVPKGTVPLKHESWQNCVRYYTKKIKRLERRIK